jgi:hypothetical protein
VRVCECLCVGVSVSVSVCFCLAVDKPVELHKLQRGCIRELRVAVAFSQRELERVVIGIRVSVIVWQRLYVVVWQR